MTGDLCAVVVQYLRSQEDKAQLPSGVQASPATGLRRGHSEYKLCKLPMSETKLSQIGVFCLTLVFCGLLHILFGDAEALAVVDMEGHLFMNV